MTVPSASPLYIVLNAASGRDDGDPALAIEAVLREAGRAYELCRVDDAHRLEQVAERAVAAARSAGGAVVAAGGDGTLNAVARAVLGSKVPCGAIPQGTFNYFARAHGIPTDTTEATRALLDARIEPVPVGLVNDRPFLVNASLGLYPESLEVREEQKQRHGRSRPVAIWAALLTVLRQHRPLRIRVERDGRPGELCTLTLFVGLNGLQLEQMGWDGAVVEQGRLAAIVLKPVSPARLVWLMARGALGRLAEAHGIDSFSFSSLTVQPARRAAQLVKVATDGETTMLRPPLEFRLAADPLLLLAPRTTPERATGT